MSAAELAASGGPRSLSAPARGFVRFLYCQNPFYILSAALVFTGLRMAFAGRPFAAAGLLASLAAYTLLMAGTAWLLIRLGQVWDDVRSLLMLVVLMFLALSVTLDDALTANALRGRWYCLGAWLFAVGVSEALLWGLKIRLRAAYRLPYHLALAQLFLYPVLLAAWMGQPEGAAIQWGLFAFAPLAALVTLSLWPAVRLGPDYVANNGTPWKWPLFPWSLFFVLGVGISLRAYYLCVSLHFVTGQESIFGWYFLAPLLAAVNVLVLERAVVSRSDVWRGVALVLPAVWVGMCAAGHKLEFVYLNFVGLFLSAFSASPLFIALVAACAFYCYAALRRVPAALDCLTLALLLLTWVGPTSMGRWSLVPAQGVPLALAAVVQAWLAWRGKESPRAVLAALLCLAALWAASSGAGPWPRAMLLSRAALVLLLFIGLFFDDRLALACRRLAAAALVALAMTALFANLPATVLPAAARELYPGVMLLAALVFGFLFRDRWFCAAAAAIACAWLVVVGRKLPGLEFVLWGLVSFALAMAISLFKAGLLNRRMLPWTAAPPEVQEKS